MVIVPLWVADTLVFVLLTFRRLPLARYASLSTMMHAMRDWPFAHVVFWTVTVLLALATVVLSYVFAKQPPEKPK